MSQILFGQKSQKAAIVISELFYFENNIYWKYRIKSIIHTVKTHHIATWIETSLKKSWYEKNLYFSQVHLLSSLVFIWNNIFRKRIPLSEFSTFTIRDSTIFDLMASDLWGIINAFWTYFLPWPHTGFCFLWSCSICICYYYLPKTLKSSCIGRPHILKLVSPLLKLIS